MSHELDLGFVVQQSSTPQQIAEHFISAIAVGALAPGDALPPERDLAVALAVSRSSLRLALDKLDRLGLVERRRGRGGGTFVLEPGSSPAARDGLRSSEMRAFLAERATLLDARALIQRLLAESAANRRAEADIETIAAAWREHAKHADSATARRTDGVFHAAIAAAARNQVLADIAMDLDTRINIGFRHDPFSRELHATAVAHHEAIADAIAAGDSATAGELSERHFRETTIDPMASRD